METPMDNQLVSQEVLDALNALNAPPEPRPLTPNRLILIKNAQQPTVQSTSYHDHHPRH
jgi:hypothetical protein